LCDVPGTTLLFASSIAIAGEFLWKNQRPGTLAGDSVNFISTPLQAGHRAFLSVPGGEDSSTYCPLKRHLGKQFDGTPDLKTLSPDNPSLGSFSGDKCHVVYQPSSDDAFALVIVNTSERDTLASIACGQQK
jgi:hypothetical protein